MNAEIIAAQRFIIQGYYNRIATDHPEIETILQWLEDDLQTIRMDNVVLEAENIISSEPLPTVTTPQQPMTWEQVKNLIALNVGMIAANGSLSKPLGDGIIELTKKYADSVKAQADEEIEILQKMSVNQEYETQGYKKSLEEAIHWLKEANQFLTGDMSDCGLQVTMFIEKAENDHQLNPYKQ